MKNKVILLIFFVVLAFNLFSNDTPKAVIVYLEDGAGNYPSSSEITFSATLKNTVGTTVGTITNASSPTSKYIAAVGVLLIECSNYSTWDNGYFLEITITYDGTETIYLNQTGNSTYNDGTFDRITLNNDAYQLYDGFNGTGSDYTPYIFGVTADDEPDVTGVEADVDEAPYDDTLEFNDGIGSRANTDIEATLNFSSDPGQTITVKQFDDQRKTIPAYGSTLPLSFDIVYGTSSVDYSANNTIYTFSWENSAGINLTGTVKALFTIDNGEVWQDIGSTSGISLLADFDGTGNTYGSKTYGIQITITGDIHGAGRGHTTSDLSFAFGQGDGDDLLALSVPSGLSGAVDTSIFGDYDYYLSWDPVAGATSYLVEKYNAGTQTWSAATGTYQTLIQSFKFSFANAERMNVYRVKAVSDADHYDVTTAPSELFGLHEYYIQQIWETNNNFFVLPVESSYSTDPAIFAAGLDCCDAIAQWDGDSWNECYYSDHLGQWINNSSFTLDFTKPVLINATTEKNIFFGGEITKDIQFTFNYSTIGSDYYICIPCDFTTTNNIVSELISDLGSEGITVSKIYRFVNSNKNWYEMENGDVFSPGQLIKVVISGGSGTWPASSRSGGNQPEIGKAGLFNGGVK
ncbi:MAG: hypothetical protein K9N06_11235 [Candidatus Cloacimonetes bacterium]|nr:hypothetical protein [Candidatus Cloacimonadota bacterium]